MNGWISGATGLALGALPVAAQAGLEVCNDTDLRQSVAIGYEAPGGVWTSEGWWQLSAGECKTVMGRDLGRRYFYYRATTPGGDFDGPFSFCSKPTAFTIAGDKDCAARGYDKTRFRKVDTGGVVMSGHSFGCYTTWASGGADYNMNAVRAAMSAA